MTASDFFHKTTSQLERQLPFVIFRKPTTSASNTARVRGIFQQDNQLHLVNDFTESGFVMAPFDLSKSAVIFPETQCTQQEAAITIIPQDTTGPHAIPVSSNAKKSHLNLVSQGINAIKNGRFEKVVLSRQQSAATTRQPIDIFKRLLQRYPSAFVYCWHHPKVGLWIGATPETLVKISGRHFNTMALAGTKSASDHPVRKWTKKERDEQQFVTDFIEHTLRPHASQLNIEETQTVKAGQLFHLQSTITGQLKQNEPLKTLLTALHPTPAVCGFPKQSAKKFILTHEPYNREFYAGFLGQLNINEKRVRRANRRNVENQAYTRTDKKTELFVNLRCLKLENKQCNLYVGGGIVANSDPESEWRETVNKSQTIIAAL